MRSRFSLLTGSCLIATAVPFAWCADTQRDQPNPIEVRRIEARRHFVERLRAAGKSPREAAGSLFAKTGQDQVLVVLVEFGGTDRFEFIPSGPNASTWDPIGRMDGSEWTGKVGDCSAIVKKYAITAPKTFTYSGPLHNEIQRPVSETDSSRTMVWREDFSKAYFEDIIFGEGTVYQFPRQDGSTVDEDVRGISVRSYFRDMSLGAYDFTGDVVGWVRVPHSVAWYGADPCPGRRSARHNEPAHNGGISKAGSARTLVTDALEAVKQQYPDLNWAQYDADGDGIIDHLWIIVAGTSEADSVMINRNGYGELGMWDHAASVAPAYSVVPGIKAGPYIMMVENVGVATLAHEYGHNLGAGDLYSYGGGRPSTGFWTNMSDNWVGHPITSAPPAMDPLHLDEWGWLDPLVISDRSREYVVQLGQTGAFPGGEGVYRGVKIELEDGRAALAVKPNGANQWWGGNKDLSNSMMTLEVPLQLPAGPVALTFNIAYKVEQEWDFLWVQASADGGKTWKTLTNEHTTCTHDRGWIGGEHGFPEDLCAARIGGFTGTSPGFPAYSAETFDLGAFSGQSVLVRFWYMTDWNSTESGPFLDDIRITAGGRNIFSDDAEHGGGWIYSGEFQRNDGDRRYKHAYYLQLRNARAEGGSDAGLANPNWRFGPVGSGLLVWYNNGNYSDNEIQKYLFDPPAFGPKGKLLVIEAHPEPYRDPGVLEEGFNNEGANLGCRMQMRDAPFSIDDSPGFLMKAITGWITRDTPFDGLPGVPLFSDSNGYYPGAELVMPGPKGETPQWVTRQWDSSAVVPSRKPYPIRAPGFEAAQPMRFNCGRDSGAGGLSCDMFGLTERVGMDGGSGNPSETGGQYGWNVEVVEQSPSQATLRIWNSLE
ncbi:MAG: immune inhibitor A [Acidobacteria bacterium]|nr:immune inhibitor A [Acidobacteriota bacterium]